MKLMKRVTTLLNQIWSVIDDRTGLSDMVGPLLDHLVPPGAKWSYVFGSATLFVFILQVVTGTALATIYIPSTQDAYKSIQFITNEATFGSLLRGIHFFGASAMVVLIGVHALRTFLTGAFKFPREANWLTGLVLLLLTLGMGFTGQLLRWDQNAIWSVVVGSEMAGNSPAIGDQLAKFILAGETLGGATLSRFTAFHVFFIPGLIFAFVGFHLYLVIRNGISEPPEVGRPVNPKTYRSWYQKMLHERGVPFWPDAAWRDVMFGVGVIVVIVSLAMIFGPPMLDSPPDPTIVQANPHPDWYLLWFFALLALTPPPLEKFAILLFPLLGGLVLVGLPFIANRGERHYKRRPWAVGAVLMIILMIGTLGIAGKQSNWSPNFDPTPLPSSVVGATSGPVADGAQLFNERGCENCHRVSGYGGRRGPDLTTVGDRRTAEQLTIRILNGGTNMPAFSSTLKPDEVNALVTFLQSRTANK
jgi:ubiquinol-cytochrome c reductase cytochrome b subunit